MAAAPGSTLRGFFFPECVSSAAAFNEQRFASLREIFARAHIHIISRLQTMETYHLGSAVATLEINISEAERSVPEGTPP